MEGDSNVRGYVSVIGDILITMGIMMLIRLMISRLYCVEFFDRRVILNPPV